MPSRKWFATQVTALGAVATMWATTGSWDTEETVALIGLAVSAFVQWATPNESAPTPAPAVMEAKPRRTRGG